MDSPEQLEGLGKMLDRTVKHQRAEIARLTLELAAARETGDQLREINLVLTSQLSALSER
jgi:hypothetical protein